MTCPYNSQYRGENQSTTRNASYIHPSHDSILELWPIFPNENIKVLNWFDIKVQISSWIPSNVAVAWQRFKLCHRSVVTRANLACTCAKSGLYTIKPYFRLINSWQNVDYYDIQVLYWYYLFSTLVEYREGYRKKHAFEPKHSGMSNPDHPHLADGTFVFDKNAQ